MSDLNNELYERHPRESHIVSKGYVLSDLMIALFQAAHPICRGDTGELLRILTVPHSGRTSVVIMQTDGDAAKIESCKVMMLA